MKSKKLDASPIKNKINTINTTLPSIQSKPNFTQNEIYYTKPLKPLDFSFRDLNNMIDLITCLPRKGLKKQQEAEVDKQDNSTINKIKNDLNEEKTLENKKKKKNDNQQEIIVKGKVFGGSSNDNKNKKRKDSQINIDSTSVQNNNKSNEKVVKFLPYTNSLILHSNNITNLNKIDSVLEEILHDVLFLEERYARSIFSSGQLNFLNFNKVDLLQWIDLSHNKLESIHPDITKLRYLKILYLHANFIQNLQEITVLSSCKALLNLTLHGNPIEHIKGYRLLVIEMMPALEKLDFTLVSEKELDIIHFKGARFGEKRNKKTGKVMIFPSLDKEILKRMNVPNTQDKKEF